MKQSKIYALAFFLQAIIISPLFSQEGGDDWNPHLADFETCLGSTSPGGIVSCDGITVPSYSYPFPQLVTCNATRATIDPPNAGTVLSLNCDGSVSGCSPSVCVSWALPGVHEITVEYSCRLGYDESRTRSVYVSLPFFNYSVFTLTNVSNCTGFYGAFTLNRTQTGGPVKRHRVEVWEIDANGNFVGSSPYWSYGWYDGDIRTREFDLTDNFSPEVGKRYKVKLLTESACGSHEYTNPTVYTANAPIPTVDFKINNSSVFPAEMFTCNEAPMILNNAATFTGCSNVNLFQARITMEQATTACGTPVPGTAIQKTLSFSQNFDLRSLFPQYANQQGFYLISYEVRTNLSNWFGPVTKCVSINSLAPSNAEFKLIPPSGVPLNRSSDPNAANAELGQLSCGLTVDGYISQLGSIDGYKIQIWRTNSNGEIVEPIFNPANFTTVDANNPLPLTRLFNIPEIANGYFLGLTQQQVLDYRFKVRLTVVNECGESFQESFFRMRPNCPFCLVNNGNNENGASIYSDSESFSLELNPNPMQEQLNVRFDLQKEGLMQFGLFDANARPVMNFQRNVPQTGDNLTEVFEVAHLPAGVYFWQMAYNGQNISGKIVKN